MTEKEAREQAKALCQKLGPKWSPSVWESYKGAWYFCASAGPVTITPFGDRPKSYGCAILEDGDEGAPYTVLMPTGVSFHEDPKKALKHAVVEAQRSLRRYMGILEKAEGVLQGTGKVKASK